MSAYLGILVAPLPLHFLPACLTEWSAPFSPEGRRSTWRCEGFNLPFSILDISEAGTREWYERSICVHPRRCRSSLMLIFPSMLIYIPESGRVLAGFKNGQFWERVLIIYAFPLCARSVSSVTSLVRSLKSSALQIFSCLRPASLSVQA